MKQVHFSDFILDVAKKEMEWVGIDPNTASLPDMAVYWSCVQRIQAWTYEALAEIVKADGDRLLDPLLKMLEEFASQTLQADLRKADEFDGR